MDRPRKAGILAQAETRSGNVAHQGPEVCVYNQPYYITFCLVYKITNSLQMDNFKNLTFKEIGRVIEMEMEVCILQEMPGYKVEEDTFYFT